MDKGLGGVFMELNIRKILDKKIMGIKTKKEEDEKLRLLREAHKEWKTKEEYFNHVVDFDLVDYAIYDAQASKLKYMYLLKKIKEEKNV